MNERSAELNAIRKTVETYVEGMRTGNVELLRQVFHPKAMMYGAGREHVLILEIESFYVFLSSTDPPSKTGEPLQCFISCIHYDGHAAFVEMIEEASFGRDYTDYFQLLKIDGMWRIVSKSYNAVPVLEAKGKRMWSLLG
jgi:4-oxalocrotonate tautomerase